MPKIIENLDVEILRQAQFIIGQKSLEELTMRDLARSCDVALGTIYNYYPTKETLLEALIRDYWEQQFIQFDDLTKRDERSVYQKLEIIYSSVETFFAQYKEMMKQVYASQPLPKTMSRAPVVEALLHRLEVLIQQAQDTAEIKATLLSRDLATFVLSNFSSMAKMKLMKFDTFENILRALLQP